MDRRSPYQLFSGDRAFEGAMNLAFHLAALRELHALDELVIADLDGTTLASSGDRDSVRALSAFAAAMLRGATAGTSHTFHCGKVHVELILLRGRLCALAAKAPFLVLDPEGLTATVAAAFARPPARQRGKPSASA
jgi:hypothetical protein